MSWTSQVRLPRRFLLLLFRFIKINISKCGIFSHFSYVLCTASLVYICMFWNESLVVCDSFGFCFSAYKLFLQERRVFHIFFLYMYVYNYATTMMLTTTTTTTTLPFVNIHFLVHRIGKKKHIYRDRFSIHHPHEKVDGFFFVRLQCERNKLQARTIFARGKENTLLECCKQQFLLIYFMTVTVFLYNTRVYTYKYTKLREQVPRN